MIKGMYNFLLVLVLMSLSGCIYSIEVQPEYQANQQVSLEPLNMSVSVLHNSNCFMKKCTISKKTDNDYIDQVFYDLMSEEGFFAKVEPSGHMTDLFIEVLHYPDLDPTISKKEAFYRDLMTITGIGFIPPFPFTFYLRTEHIFRLSTVLNDQTYVFREYEFVSYSKIKAAGVLGARYKRTELMEYGIRYLMPFFIDSLRNDYEYLLKIQDAISQQNEVSLHALSINADNSTL